MSELALEIRMLRQQSVYPERTRFAREAGISLRQMEYIEAGTKVPRPATLDKIIRVAGLPNACAAQLHVLREEAAAAKGSVSVQQRDAHQLPRLVERLVADSVFEMRRGGVVVTDDVACRLRATFANTLRSVLDPPKNTTGTTAVRGTQIDP